MERIHPIQLEGLRRMTPAKKIEFVEREVLLSGP